MSTTSRARRSASQRVPGPTGGEHELHRAAVIRAHVVDGERPAQQHRRVRPADGDRDELARAEARGDARRDHGHRV